MECSWWIYFRICLATHQEWVWSFCTGECSQHRSATMEKVHGCLEFLCIVQFLFYFVLLAWNCACLSALQYWLGYVCKCKASAYKSTCYCFSQGQNNHAPSLVSQSKTLQAGSVRLHLPHNMQQCTPCSYVQNQKPAVTGRSNGQHWDQCSRWRHGIISGQRTLYYASHVFLCMCKRLSTLFNNWNGLKGSSSHAEIQGCHNPDSDKHVTDK